MKKKIIVHETADFIHEIIVQIDNEEGEEMVDEIIDGYTFTSGTDFRSIMYDLEQEEDVTVSNVNIDRLGLGSEITDVYTEDLEDEE